MAIDPQTVASAFYASLQQAWNGADGAAFGAAFTTDASFVDIRGVAHDGAAAIAGGHQAIFDSIYKGSVVRYDLVSAQAVSDDVIVARGHGTLDAPGGPMAGVHDAVNTIVLVRSNGDWQGAAFHNTLVTA